MLICTCSKLNPVSYFSAACYFSHGRNCIKYYIAVERVAFDTAVLSEVFVLQCRYFSRSTDSPPASPTEPVQHECLQRHPHHSPVSLPPSPNNPHVTARRTRRQGHITVVADNGAQRSRTRQVVTDVCDRLTRKHCRRSRKQRRPNTHHPYIPTVIHTHIIRIYPPSSTHTPSVCTHRHPHTHHPYVPTVIHTHTIRMYPPSTTHTHHPYVPTVNHTHTIRMYPPSSTHTHHPYVPTVNHTHTIRMYPPSSTHTPSVCTPRHPNTSSVHKTVAGMDLCRNRSAEADSNRGPSEEP